MTDSPEARKPRFASDALHFQPDAPLRHFIPVTSDNNIPRDRFGNRVFTSSWSLPNSPSEKARRIYRSSNQAYVDRGGHETKAALLISKEGEDFLRKNPGILNDIDQSLVTFIDSLENAPADQIVKKFDLNKGRQMTNISLGHEGQSSVFLLETPTGKYVIKVKSPANPYGNDVSQPYINEMLQTQTLAHDLQDELTSVGISMPRFLFASGQMSCAIFEEGGHPTHETMQDKLATLLPIIKRYKSAQEGDLWENISFDAQYQTTAPNRGLRTKTDNFIERSDGSIVWIDPLVYHSRGLPRLI